MKEAYSAPITFHDVGVTGGYAQDQPQLNTLRRSPTISF
jgi:hypothetical protein